MNIDKLKICDACGLRGDVIKGFGKKKFVSYHTFCFYYSAQDIISPRFMIVMQNPGQPSHWTRSDEFKNLSKVTDDANYLAQNKRDLINWLRNKNLHFFSGFIQKLNDYNLIKYNLNDVDFDQKFLSDFFFTDAVKCRTQTENISSLYADTCYETYLKDELEQFGRNKLIFVFSSRAWERIYEHFVDRGASDEKFNKVTKAHGRLLGSEKLNSHFIPLAHFSPGQFNKFLRNSYFEYLEEGLKKYSESLKTV